jgi:hypothetical protein
MKDEQHWYRQLDDNPQHKTYVSTTPLPGVLDTIHQVSQVPHGLTEIYRTKKAGFTYFLCIFSRIFAALTSLSKILRPQSIGLSDIGLTKKTIDWPPVFFLSSLHFVNIFF